MMPGRDYPRAYALLEQSLNGVDTLYLPEKKSQPDADRSWLDTPSPNPPGSPKVNGLKFPPTPPSISHSDKRKENFAPTSDPDTVAPYNAQDDNALPTPEVTPPHGANGLARAKPTQFPGTFLSTSLNPSYSSPDSFRTANEAQSADGEANEPLSALPHVRLDSGSNQLFLAGVDASGDAQLEDPMRSLDGEKHDLGKAVHTLRHKHSYNELDRIVEQERRSSKEIDNAWDPEKMRNVTMRRKHFKTQSADESRDEPIPVLMRGLSLKDRNAVKSPNGQVRTPSPVEEATAVEWATPSSHGASPRATESDRKRFSGTSGSSTVVEAVVIDSPPPRKRKLRHAAKTAALRDDASMSGTSRPNTANSDDPPLYQLLRSEYQPSETLNRNSFGSDASADLPIPKLRRQRDVISRGSSALSDSGTDSSANENHFRLRPLFPFDTYDRRSVSAPVRSKAPLAAAAEQATASSMFSHRARFRSLEMRHSPEGFLPLDETLTAKPDGAAPSKLVHYATAKDSQRENNDSPQGMDESFQRNSIGYSGDTSSLQDSNAMRSLHSLKSDNSALQVNEATAVNLYAHNNNSIVMVQQSKAPIEIQVHQAAVVSPLTLANGERAYISIEPSTPPGTNDPTFLVDSSLRNPRDAPEPPIVAVIPPTPAKELEEQEEVFHKGGSTPSSPQQRTSLVRRAFLQPLATLATGNTNVVNRSSMRNIYPHAGRSGSAIRSPPVSEPSQQDGRLHPFWQPRRFWNDFSDSEDEDSEFGDEGQRELPTGGDFRDITTANTNSTNWRRGGSMRGFLIGNSLGIQRGPTNKRRHVVNLPRHVSVRDSARRSKATTPSRTKFNYLQSLRQRLRTWTPRAREEQKRRNQRERLRKSIGSRFYHPNSA